MTNKEQEVVTRFAPSPTGYLHIGGARTALFNWLFTRHHGGRFLLRIEDTDRKRSTEEAIEAILDGLRWLELDWDGPEVYQFARAERHAAVAHALLENGKAYRCYCTPEELAEMREAAKKEGRPMLYDRRWRDRDPNDAPKDAPFVVRIKMPLEGETVIDDAVQGSVTVPNSQLDDMVLLRGDGTPTYMLSVVVDDHDMGITHVIRGDDHLTNAFRQAQVFKAMDWPVPVFAHIPLIHGPDGAKLSKRHGALGVEAYRDMGYLPEALCNYLVRLGWSHGDEEIFSRTQAVEWFDLPEVNKSASRLDFAKLEALNGHYIRESDNDLLTSLVINHMKNNNQTIDNECITRIKIGMEGLKARAKTIPELAQGAEIYIWQDVPEFEEKVQKNLQPENLELLKRLSVVLQDLTDWDLEVIEGSVRGFVELEEIKFGKIAQPLRAALTGRSTSPGIFEVMHVLGKRLTLHRIESLVN